MNGDSQEHQQEDGEESSEEEIQEKRAIAIQSRRQKIYEEKKRRMANIKKPASISDILNKEEKTLEPQTKFLNVKVHTRVSPDQHNEKSQTGEDLVHLVGEIEITEFLTFEGLIPKAIELFNSQLKDKGHDIEIHNKLNKNCFRFAKKNGEADSNFPSFDGTQKVGDCGVTNICLIVDKEEIAYSQMNPSA